MELRCQAKKHAVLEGQFIEVKCNSRFCGSQLGTVVIHRFDRTTGEMIETLQFKDPVRKDRGNASHRNPAAVRSA